MVKGSEPTQNEPNEKRGRAAPVFTQKENATLEQRIEILDWLHENDATQTETAKHFDPIYPNLKIKQPLVSAWVKLEDKLRADWANATGQARTAKRVRQTQHPDVTEMMDLWVSEAMSNNILITGEILRQKWTRFADLVGIPEDNRLSLSDGWLARFKVRNGLKEFTRHGKAASVGAETVEKERERIQELIRTYDVKPRDLFNADETGFFYA